MSQLHPADSLPPKTRGGRVYERRSVADRFWEKVDRSSPDGCWPWTGARSAAGYGNLRINNVTWLASRVSWVLHHGDLPRGSMVLHHCDNPPCVRPDHLFLGDATANQRDAVNKGRFGRLARPEAWPKGAKHHFAKLTEDQVRQIRALAKEGLPLLRIAKQFGVSGTNIGFIVRRVWWKHLEDT